MSRPVIEAAVSGHYADVFASADRLEQALAGLKAAQGGRSLTAEDLIPIDQLHTGGVQSTARAIALLAPRRGDHVIDVGSGVGGPARLLAHRTGARVTGIDLTPAFVAVAERLTAETGQAATVRFQVGSALALPFGAASFDAGWHIHMSMNIADKARLYAEICRVLKPGGRFVLYDPIRGPGADEPVFPVPWAERPETSFLLRRDDMCRTIEAAGLHVIETLDGTTDALAWFDAIVRREAEATPEMRARLLARQDPRLPLMSANHRRNLESGAVTILGAVLEKPA